MTRAIAIIILLTVAAALMRPHTACAQVTGVIADMETHTPIRNVKLFTNKGDVYVTDYTGRYTISKSFESLSASHVSYLERKVSKESLGDTLYLLPRENSLGTVYVWGQDRKNIKSMVKSAVRDAPAYSPQGGIGGSFDFFALFQKKPLDRKSRKKNEHLLKNWDRLYGPVYDRSYSVTDSIKDSPKTNEADEAHADSIAHAP